MPESLVATADGRTLEISPQKFEILSLLARKPDHVITMPELCEEIWDADNKETRTLLRVHVSGLRGELGVDLGDLKQGAIRTQYGRGYMSVRSLDGSTEKTAAASGSDSLHLIADARVAVDTGASTVRSDNLLLHDITRTEFELLAALARKPGAVVETPVLQQAIWGRVTDKTYASARVAVSRIRAKLGMELGHKREGAIRSRQGVGYYAVESLRDS